MQSSFSQACVVRTVYIYIQPESGASSAANFGHIGLNTGIQYMRMQIFRIIDFYWLITFCGSEQFQRYDWLQYIHVSHWSIICFIIILHILHILFNMLFTYFDKYKLQFKWLKFQFVIIKMRVQYLVPRVFLRDYTADRSAVYVPVASWKKTTLNSAGVLTKTEFQKSSSAVYYRAEY